MNLKYIKIDLFVIAIAVSVVLAYFLPQLGSSNSPIPLDSISSWGIALIFFFYGLKLRTEEIKSGLKNWKLHLVVQGSTFVLFPLIILAFYPLFQNTSHELIWFSFLFMAALPSTVSSSVVLVSLAKGNVPAAIFNASISGIIGILLTPLWVTPFIQETNIDYDFSTIYSKLFLEIVVPLILGLLLRRFFGKYARKHVRTLGLFDKFVILLIIYKSFVHSFEDQVFSQVKTIELFVITAVVIALFFFMYYVTGWIGKRLNFSREDQITTQFCGTKKSLVHGTVFSEALFGQSSVIGIILLPLMIFHALQIFIISIFATKMSKDIRNEKPLGE